MSTDVQDLEPHVQDLEPQVQGLEPEKQDSIISENVVFVLLLLVRRTCLESRFSVCLQTRPCFPGILGHKFNLK